MIAVAQRAGRPRIPAARRSRIPTGRGLYGWYCGASWERCREILDHSALFDSNDHLTAPAGIYGSRSKLPPRLRKKAVHNRRSVVRRTLINARWPANIVGKLGRQSGVVTYAEMGGLRGECRPLNAHSCVVCR